MAWALVTRNSLIAGWVRYFPHPLKKTLFAPPPHWCCDFCGLYPIFACSLSTEGFDSSCLWYESWWGWEHGTWTFVHCLSPRHFASSSSSSPTNHSLVHKRTTSFFLFSQYFHSVMWSESWVMLSIFPSITVHQSLCLLNHYPRPSKNFNLSSLLSVPHFPALMWIVRVPLL